MSPAVDMEVAQERLVRLTDRLAAVAAQRLARWVGQEAEVLVESWEEGAEGETPVAVGRTCGQAPEIDGVTYIEEGLPAGVEAGDLVTVRVTEALGYDLAARYEGGRLDTGWEGAAKTGGGAA